MKTLLKTFLAWLDWSTFCKSDEFSTVHSDYNFPKSGCLLFWRTMLSLVAIIPTWFVHPWNLLTVSGKAFRQEESRVHKLNILTGIIFHFLIMLGSIFAHKMLDVVWKVDWYHMSDPFLLTYFKLIAGGIAAIIFFGACIAAFFGILYLLYSGYERLTENKSPEDFVVIKTVDSFVKKYCPEMDWSSVRNKK